jgi:hypothetical protein
MISIIMHPTSTNCISNSRGFYFPSVFENSCNYNLNKHFFDLVQCNMLTPKGSYVPRVTKPVLVNVAWPHTIFRFFETFCEDESRTKLHVSTNFIIFGSTDQKLWVFEVFGQGLAKAGMCWNQPARVHHLCKKWRVGEKKIQKEKGSLAYPSINPWSATNGRPPAASWHLDRPDGPFFFWIFLFF